MDDIYKMKLHDKIEIKSLKIDIIRVPGGWIYSEWSSIGMTNVFVPYNKEFDKL